MRRLTPIFFMGWIALAWSTVSASASEPATALVGGTLHPVSGPSVENATLLMDQGQIVAVGTEVELPPGTREIDLTGKHVYPGFIHSATILGLIEVGSVAGTRDFMEIGDINPELRAEVAWNADSQLLPVAMAGGILSAHVIPQGGVFTGTSAVMRLEGWNWQDMTVRTPVGLHVSFPSVGGGGDDSEEEQAEAREKALATLNDTLDDARAYGKAKTAGSANLDMDLKLEALQPLLAGEQTLFLHASERRQIEQALDWAEEQGFEDVVLIADSDARHLAGRLAEKKFPVILDGVLDLPERQWEPYDSAFTVAKDLHEAGVLFAIAGSGAANARNLPFHAAMAASFGLPKDIALRSLTLSPAEILGVADHLGSLDPGKEATFFVANGDPLEIVTQIERVWVRGQEIAPEGNHQWRLYQKYKNRPRRDGSTTRLD